MSKQIEVMGVALNDDCVWEMLPVVDTYLNNSEMNFLVAVSMRMLVMAQQDPQIREILQSFDVALPGEVGILAQAGNTNNQLKREIEDNSFFGEFMRMVQKQEKTVYLLGETSMQCSELGIFIKRYYGQTRVVGECALNDWQDVAEVINRINIAAPDVILSVIPSPRQELFIHQQKSMLHAKVWYGLNDTYKLRSGARALRAKASSILHHLNFKQLMANYNKEKQVK